MELVGSYQLNDNMLISISDDKEIIGHNMNSLGYAEKKFHDFNDNDSLPIKSSFLAKNLGTGDHDLWLLDMNGRCFYLLDHIENQLTQNFTELIGYIAQVDSNNRIRYHKVK